MVRRQAILKKAIVCRGEVYDSVSLAVDESHHKYEYATADRGRNRRHSVRIESVVRILQEISFVMKGE